MIILDTDVFSALMRSDNEPALLRFLDGLAPGSVWLTAITVFEIQSGILRLPIGRKRSTLTIAFEHYLRTDFADRCLQLDLAAAEAAATLKSARESAGVNIAISDTLIAGIAIAHGAKLATRNTRHFEDLPGLVINPWADAS